MQVLHFVEGRTRFFNVFSTLYLVQISGPIMSFYGHTWYTNSLWAFWRVSSMYWFCEYSAVRSYSRLRSFLPLFWRHRKFSSYFAHLFSGDTCGISYRMHSLGHSILLTFEVFVLVFSLVWRVISLRPSLSFMAFCVWLIVYCTYLCHGLALL